MNQRIDQLTKLLKGENTEDFVLFALAKEYDKIGEHQRSIQFFEKLINQNKEYTGAYYHLALALRASGLEDKALETIHHGIDICQSTNKIHDKNELESLIDA